MKNFILITTLVVSNTQFGAKKSQFPQKFETLSGNEVSKVALPNFISLADKYRYTRKSNVPGHFPFVAGIFPSKRTDEDPKRMFAGENNKN